MSEKTPRTVRCEFCEGSGKRLSPEWAKAARIKAGLSQMVVAAKMQIRQTYLCDMEKGRRRFTPAQEHEFLRAIKETP